MKDIDNREMRVRQLKNVLEGQTITHCEVEAEKTERAITSLTLHLGSGVMIKIGSQECIATDVELTFTLVVKTEKAI